MNAAFPYPLQTTHLPDGRNLALLSSFAFDDEGHEGFIVVPVAFVTDLASIPRVFWLLLPPFGEYLFGAVVHDWLYTTRTLGAGWHGWRGADMVLWRAMQQAPSPPALWVRCAIMAGLFLGGWFTYFAVKERVLHKLGVRRGRERFDDNHAPGAE